MSLIKPFKMNIFGGLGGSGGGFSGSYASDIQNPTTTAQAQQSYADQQAALAQQQGLITALQGQHGIQNQSNVFNQQQGLANQLQAQTQGAGPNPAQAQLAQNTAANTQNQAALMAGQRGTGANAGLLARQAGQQGAANQQASIGQAATLQAQQQLAAQQQLQQQQQAMAGLSSTQTGQLQNAIGGQNQYALQGQQNILNGIAAQNNAAVGMQSNINNVNAGIQGGNQSNQAGLLGGGLSAIGSGLSSFFADGGEVQPDTTAAPITGIGPQSKLGQALKMKQGDAESQSAMFLQQPSTAPTGGSNANQLNSGMMNLAGSVGKNFLTSGSSAEAGEGAAATEGGGEGAMAGEGAAAEGGAGGGSGLAAAWPAAIPVGLAMIMDNNKNGQLNLFGDAGAMHAAYKGGEQVNHARPGNGLPPRAASGPGPYGSTSEYQYAAPKQEKHEDTSVLGESFDAYKSQGGSVDVMVSPGEKMYYPGGRVEKVKGKAQVDGDSLKNDTVPKKVPAHTVVVPRTKADGGSKEAQFVAAILARKGMKK